MATTQSRKLLASTLENDDSFATTLLAIVFDKYGTELFAWDPESLWMAIAEDFGAIPPRINQDKLQALITCYTTDLFYISVEFFITTCNVLSGAEANFKRFDPADAEEIIWGIYEVALNVSLEREPNESLPEFSHEVRRYIGIALDNDGVFDPPDVLRIAEMPERAELDQWADDPDMFNAAHDHAKTERSALLGHLAHQLAEMMTELNSVVSVLENYDKKRWEKFSRAVEANIPKIREERSRAALART
jgi:hypothetical protein